MTELLDRQITQPTVTEALANVMEDVRAVAKGDTNTQQQYKFRGIDAVVNAVGPALRRHRVIVTPDVRSIEYAVVHVGRNQTPMGHVRVVVSYTFHGPDGSTLSCSAPGEAMDSGDKATPKAMSVAYRTALLQALCLPTDEPDPDAQSYERAQAPVVRDERMEVLRSLHQAAVSQGVDPDAVKARWANDHDGQDINQATDLDVLYQLLDKIRRGEWVA
jgi:hypothetical protein